MSGHLHPIDAGGDRGNRVAATRRLFALFVRVGASGIHAPALRQEMLRDNEAMGRRPGPGRLPRAPRTVQIDAAHHVRNRLNALPDDLDRLQAAIEDALAEPPHEALTGLQVGVALDAIPYGQARDDGAQGDTIVALLVADGFGPQLVARACDIIVRTRHGTPAPAAFLEAAGKAKGELESARSALLTYRRLRARADELIALAASMGNEPSALLPSPAEVPMDVKGRVRRPPGAPAG